MSVTQVESVKINKKIILASASPRRRELLSLVTKEFAVVTADVDERAAEIKMEEEGTPALKVSEHLAEIKAKAVFDSLSEEEKENSIVIGADTSVILGDVIYGKPEDREDAVRMLRAQSMEPQTVITGVALVSSAGISTFSEKTMVYFHPLDEVQETRIQAYCDTDEPYDKAGGYGIQLGGASLVDHYVGDFDNVIGFPTGRILSELKALDIDI